MVFSRQRLMTMMPRADRIASTMAWQRFAEKGAPRRSKLPSTRNDDARGVHYTLHVDQKAP